MILCERYDANAVVRTPVKKTRRLCVGGATTRLMKIISSATSLPNCQIIGQASLACGLLYRRDSAACVMCATCSRYLYAAGIEEGEVRERVHHSAHGTSTRSIQDHVPCPSTRTFAVRRWGQACKQDARPIIRVFLCAVHSFATSLALAPQAYQTCNRLPAHNYHVSFLLLFIAILRLAGTYVLQQSKKKGCIPLRLPFDAALENCLGALYFLQRIVKGSHRSTDLS